MAAIAQTFNQTTIELKYCDGNKAAKWKGLLIRLL